MKSVLAIDLGASSGVAILTEVKNNKIITKEINRFKGYVIDNQKNMKWDMPLIMEEIYKSIKIAEELAEIDSLSINTWGVDFGLLDKDGLLIQNPYHYRDRRTHGYVSKVNEIIDSATLYEKTGIQTMEINTLFQLYAIKEEEPELLDKAEHLLMMPDLINYYLTGEIKTERTIASTTQFYNPNLKNWDYELIEKLGIKTNIFSEIIEPGDIIGNLKESLVKKLNITNKKVIAIGSHDTASAIACTPYDGKSLFLSSGTWSLIGTQLENPVISEETYRYNLSNETGVDNKITLLKNITGLWLIQEAKKQFEREGKKYDYSDLSRLAEGAKSIDCYFDTELTELTVPGNIPKRIKLLAKKTNQVVPETDGEVIRTIYENLALKYRTAYKEITESVNQTFEKIYVIGGGSKIDFLSQLTANSLNLEVNAGYPEATAIGNSLVQMKTLKIIEESNEKDDLLERSFTNTMFLPENIEFWDDKYKKYKKIIEK